MYPSDACYQMMFLINTDERLMSKANTVAILDFETTGLSPDMGAVP